MGDHLTPDGSFQSDKYPSCPPGKVPLSVNDHGAQDLLWEYAQRRRAIDADFSDDLETALRNAGDAPDAAPCIYAGPHCPGCQSTAITRREVRRLREALRAIEEQINTPETREFVVAVVREAAHQRMRWGSEHDAGKTDADWFWLIGYLAGKALHNPIEAPPADVVLTEDDAREKRLHRIITVAAAAANWHAAILGRTNMRPGIAPPSDRQHAAPAGAATR